MITSGIIIFFLVIVQAIFSVIPDLPAMPQAVIDGGDWVVDAIAEFSSFLSMLYGPTLGPIIVLVVGYYAFEHLYGVTLWVLKKIPALNIK